MGFAQDLDRPVFARKLEGQRVFAVRITLHRRLISRHRCERLHTFVSGRHGHAFGHIVSKRDERGHDNRYEVVQITFEGIKAVGEALAENEIRECSASFLKEALVIALICLKLLSQQRDPLFERIDALLAIFCPWPKLTNSACCLQLG